MFLACSQWTHDQSTANSGADRYQLKLITNDINAKLTSRRETIEVNPEPVKICDDVLEASVCKALLLTGLNIALGDLHACHRLKRLDRIINLVNKNSQWYIKTRI